MAEAFIDESWSPASFGDDYFLAVVSVITANRRALELAVRRLKRTPRLKAKSELKAPASSRNTIVRFLHMLADDPGISIVAVIWKGSRRSIEDYEKLYQQVVGQCALQTVTRYSRIDLFIDKRYTTEKRQRELETGFEKQSPVFRATSCGFFRKSHTW